MENQTIKEMLQENINDILQLKEQGLTLEEIGVKYGTSRHNIGRALKAIGKPARNILTDDIKILLVNDYNNGIPINNLTKKYHFGASTISKILKECNVHITEPTENNKKYTLNENYFDNIYSQEQAYIIGLLMADGNVYHNNIQIRLQERDKDILEHINKLLDSNRPLYFIDYHNKYGNNGWNRQDQWSLNITNKHMANQLKLLGVVERKSLILEYPDWLPNDLFKHFIRGYIDGDGSIYTTRNAVSFVGTYNFCNIVKEKILELLNIKVGISQDKRCTNCFSLYIKNYNDAKTFLDYIYQDATIYLQRKYDIYYEKYIDNSQSA